MHEGNGTSKERGEGKQKKYKIEYKTRAQCNKSICQVKSLCNMEFFTQMSKLSKTPEAAF
jgi:hypothetical protein